MELLSSSNLESLNTPDARGRTPLHWATIRGSAFFVQSLLRAGADLNLVDELNSTALTSAASSGNSRILESFVRENANVRSTNARGDTALHYASRHQNGVEAVEILLQAGSEIDCRNNVGNTPLTGAAITNRRSIGEYLISNGAHVHNRGMYGDTPLFETIYHNSHQFLRLLLSQGVRYTDLNGTGSSILHAAALEADLTTVEILASTRLAGLDPYLRNTRGETALEVLSKRLCMPGGFEAAFRRLLRKLSVKSLSIKQKVD
jgi:ankyrin repeat protein